ncbi:hypothetical protein GOBAR_DD16733 [Gossypium barbadense]|nr:hypothetical protein GOBAR_DD16733 [Gossypium barbadense]
MDRILTIPIGGVQHGDERVWRGDNTGLEVAGGELLSILSFNGRVGVPHFLRLLVHLACPAGCGHEHNSVSRIVFRDNEGYILAVCTYSNSFEVDSTTTEVRACLQAVTVAKDLGLWRLEGHKDSKSSPLDLWLDRRIEWHMLWRRNEDSGPRPGFRLKRRREGWKKRLKGIEET